MTGKPYDLVVCLIYLRAYTLALGCVEVESEGEWGWGWECATVAYGLLWPGDEVRRPDEYIYVFGWGFVLLLMADGLKGEGS